MTKDELIKSIIERALAVGYVGLSLSPYLIEDMTEGEYKELEAFANEVFDDVAKFLNP